MSEFAEFYVYTHTRPGHCVDTGEVFDCALAAAQHFGSHYATLVGQCCRGVIKLAHGHVFEYVRRENGI